MAFLDELGKVISDKSREAASKVKDITGVIQLKSKLSAEKEKVNQAYIILGKAYYDRHERSTLQEYPDEFKLIEAGLIKIAALEDEIAELEGTRVCAECGAKVEKNAMYCSRCGASMQEPASVFCEEADEEEQDAALEEEDEPVFAGKDSENEEQGQ